MAAKNGLWITVGIVALGGIFLALSLKQEKPVAPAPEAVPASVPAVSVTATAVPVAASPAVPAAAAPKGIKPIHQPDAAVKTPAAHPASGLVNVPKAAKAHDAYAVQVASFKDKVRADVVLKQLKDKGYSAYVMMSDLGARGVFYRVRVGSFATEEEAKKNHEAINRDFKSAIIVAE
ncbi:MAG: SPOR domain-containing protein [Candidatus Omnitrophota bacterium]